GTVLHPDRDLDDVFRCAATRTDDAIHVREHQFALFLQCIAVSASIRIGAQYAAGVDRVPDAARGGYRVLMAEAFCVDAGTFHVPLAGRIGRYCSLRCDAGLLDDRYPSFVL